MTRDIGFGEGMLLSENIGWYLCMIVVGLVIFIGMSFALGETAKERVLFSTTGLVATTLLTGVMTWFIAVPEIVSEKQDDHAVQNIEENYDIQNVEIIEKYDSDNAYHITVSFNHNESPYSYEARLSYNDDYGVMVPVVAADYDTLPIKEGSVVDELLEKTGDTLSTESISPLIE